MKNIFNLYSLVLISLLIVGNVQAQQWTIDDELKDATLKVPFDEFNIEAGKAVYDKSCKVCHKDMVVADINDRVLPTAPNLGNKVFQTTNTDGAIFSKIAYGNGAGMPPMAAMVSEEERWQVIAYLRSYSESYQPAGVAEAVAVEKFEGKITNITVAYDKEKNAIIAQLEGVDAEGVKIIPNNVKVDIFVKRYFGSLPLCEGRKTDKQGMISADLSNVPTDTSGYISVVAATSDGSKSVEQILEINDGWKYVNPLDERQLWGKSSRTPLWLLISYLGVTFAVLSVIGWAAFQLFRIWNLRER